MPVLPKNGNSAENQFSLVSWFSIGLWVLFDCCVAFFVCLLMLMSSSARSKFQIFFPLSDFVASFVRLFSAANALKSPCRWKLSNKNASVLLNECNRNVCCLHSFTTSYCFLNIFNEEAYCFFIESIRRSIGFTKPNFVHNTAQHGTFLSELACKPIHLDQ